MPDVETRPKRDARAFTAKGGHPAGMVSEEHCSNAGLHDPGTWARVQNITIGDLMRLSGFRERTAPPRDGAMGLNANEMAAVVKALEIHTGMNYYPDAGSGHGAANAEYACAACCTCL